MADHNVNKLDYIEALQEVKEIAYKIIAEISTIAMSMPGKMLLDVYTNVLEKHQEMWDILDDFQDINTFDEET